MGARRQNRLHPRCRVAERRKGKAKGWQDKEGIDSTAEEDTAVQESTEATWEARDLGTI